MPNDEPLKVYLVNPPIQDPWRTRADYEQDQRRSKVQFWIAIGTMLTSLVSVIATSAVAIVTILGAA